MVTVTIYLLLAFFCGLVSRKLEQTVFTLPIVFTAVGWLTAEYLSGLNESTFDLAIFLHLAEAGLVLLLFTDASRIDLALLQKIRRLSVRLLTTGMLLTIILGALAALVVFGQLTIWEAGILAAILAPTDAGLGQIIVNSPRIPLRIRQSLNVEAGLNDGLSVPFLLFFMALAEGGRIGTSASLTRFILEQLGLGVVVGAAIGLAGGWLLNQGHRHNWIDESFQQICVVILPLLCLIVSRNVDASMFIAAFVAGLFVQLGYRDAGRHSVQFTEEWGQLLNLAVFFLFGMLMERAWQQLELVHGLYAVLSLTLVRMAPVAIALLGTRMSRPTVLFMGWFGPRGLASIVLGLVYLERELHNPGGATIRLAVVATVLLSIFAHGLSAIPGITWYEKKIAVLDADAPEMLAPGGNERK